MTAVTGLIRSAGGPVGWKGSLQVTRSNHSFTPNTPGPRANTMHTARCTVGWLSLCKTCITHCAASSSVRKYVNCGASVALSANVSSVNAGHHLLRELSRVEE